MRLAFCCVGRAQGPGYVGCLSTLPYSDNPVLQDYGSFSNDIALLLDAIAPAIDDATSKATFCTNLGGALDSVNLPATNACLQEFSQTLEEFGCNTGSAGGPAIAVRALSPAQAPVDGLPCFVSQAPTSAPVASTCLKSTIPVSREPVKSKSFPELTYTVPSATEYCFLNGTIRGCLNITDLELSIQAR